MTGDVQLGIGAWKESGLEIVVYGLIVVMIEL